MRGTPTSFASLLIRLKADMATHDASEEFAAKHHLSVEGVRGGAATALPEFGKKAAAP